MLQWHVPNLENLAACRESVTVVELICKAVILTLVYYECFRDLKKCFVDMQCISYMMQEVDSVSNVRCIDKQLI